MANNDFKGEKILLSSERLVFNSATDDTLFKSKGMIHFTAGDSVRFDIGPLGSTNTDNLFIVNAPRIQFGIATKGREVEPVVKGKALAATLKDLMTAITDYADGVTAAVPESSEILQQWADKLRQDLSLVQMDLDSPGIVKSDITYTI